MRGAAELTGLLHRKSQNLHVTRQCKLNASSVLINSAEGNYAFEINILILILSFVFVTCHV